MKLFITGASGYIGGSFLTKALKLGYQVSCFDNFSNSNIEPINKLRQKYKFKFCHTDLNDYDEISALIKDLCPDVVVHFAALKSVPESDKYQNLYTINNVQGTKSLLEAMKENGISNLIFSSSAAVYGNQDLQPVSESSNIMPISHYAKTKVECERIIKEYCDRYNFNSISLRYFNPLGIHAENIFYDSIKNSERNVLGNLMACHLDIKPFFKIYGNDYPTHDGSAIRDYIHIDDLIEGHIASLNIIENQDGYEVINLGSNAGVSVFELVDVFTKVAGKKIPTKVAPRRVSDLAISYADTKKSNKILKWKTKKTLEEMCKSCLDFYENR
jgi:UDP-glucose 4-epimerase